MNSSEPKKDQHEKAERLITQFKSERRKGEIVLMFDGSGTVAKVKRCEYV